MSGIGDSLNLAIVNMMKTLNAGNTKPTGPVQTPSQSLFTNTGVQDPTLPTIGLAGTPFAGSSQPLTVDKLGTPVKQMDAQDAVSLGGTTNGTGNAGNTAGEGAGEGAGGGKRAGKKGE